MKRRSILFAVAVLVTGALQFVPSHATGAAACQLVGTVNVSKTNLADATKGSGSFATTASALSCTGSVVGTGAVSGSFSFCRHNHVDGTNVACHGTAYNGPDPTLDPIYDTLVMNPPDQGLAAHFKGGPVTAGPFAVGGTCSFNFEGHSIAAQAEITITNFVCTGLTGNTLHGKATASSAFVVEACNTANPSEGVCFEQVVFIGTIEVDNVV